MKRITTGAALALVIFALLPAGFSLATWPGNIPFQVNYNNVLDGQISVCEQSANMPSFYIDWADT